MIAIGIVTTWLTLTAAGFAGLSALSRAGAREERQASLTPAELQSSRWPTRGSRSRRRCCDEPDRRPSSRPVLLAGADANRRAVLRAEFGATLPRRTTFSEADDVSGVLERAPSSRMVILAGGLDDADAGRGDAPAGRAGTRSCR